MVTCGPGAWASFRVNLSLAVVQQDQPELLTSTPPIRPLPMWSSSSQCWPSPPSCCPPRGWCPPQPSSPGPWWWWYPPGGSWWWQGGSQPLNVGFTIDWTKPQTLAANAAVPSGTWLFVGGTTGPINVAPAFQFPGPPISSLAHFVFSDGTMTVNAAGIIYPVTAATVPCPMPAPQSQQMLGAPQQFRSLGAAATPRHMIDDMDDDPDDWIVNQTVVHPGQTTTVWSDGWNLRLCGNGQAMLVKVSQ